QAEDGIRDGHVTGVQTCALPIWSARPHCGGKLERVDVKTKLRTMLLAAAGVLGSVAVAHAQPAPDPAPAPAAPVPPPPSPAAERAEARRAGKRCRRRRGPDRVQQ